MSLARDFTRFKGDLMRAVGECLFDWIQESFPFNVAVRAIDVKRRRSVVDPAASSHCRRKNPVPKMNPA
jgi:hypothetical protein